MNKAYLIIIVSLWSWTVSAAIDIYQFKDEHTQQRFQQLTAELRCPKCQNQTLADSNSEIANDLRTKVYQMLAANNSDEAIIDYMLERYGEFVLYKPRFSRQTFLLWYGPVLLLIIGVISLILILRYQLKKIPEDSIKTSLDQQQQQTLVTLLNPNDENNS
jgi:cytochrome c-type biogenesis protein CcmH